MSEMYYNEYMTVSTLKHKPRATLTDDEAAVVRAWEADYRRKRREMMGGILREKHRDYCRQKSREPNYQKKRAEYRSTHKEDAREYLKTWRQANPERVALYTARQRARRHGEEPPSLGEDFATRKARKRDTDVAADKIAQMELFLADGAKTRSDVMAFLHITDEDAFDTLLEAATQILPGLWEDDDGSLGLDY